MSRVGKKTVATVATMMCIVLALSVIVLALSIAGPLSEAQSTDNKPPNTTIHVSGTPGDNGWYISNTTVTFTATDTGGSGVAHTYYHFDDGSGDIIYTPGSSIPIPEGNHTIIYHSLDNANNPEPIQAYNIGVDTKLPTMNKTETPTNPLAINWYTSKGWYNSTVVVNLTAADTGDSSIASGISSISYSLDGGTWTKYTGNITVTHGSHTISYGCLDYAGNGYNGSTTIKVFDPNINVYPVDSVNAWTKDKTNINAAFTYDTQDTTIAHLEQRSGTNDWSEFSGTINIYWEGNTTIFYRAISTDGVVGPTHVVWFGLDNSAPWIDFHIDGSKSNKEGYYEGDITVHIDAYDIANAIAPNSTQWCWDNSSWDHIYNGPFKLSNQKSKTMYYRTTDMGNHTFYGNQFIYFKPASVDQGSMSDSKWVDGQLIGPSSGTGPSDETPTWNPSRNPTPIPSPSPTVVPSPSPEAEGSNTPLAIGILVAVLVLIGLAAVAAYLFVFKPK